MDKYYRCDWLPQSSWRVGGWGQGERNENVGGEMVAEVRDPIRFRKVKRKEESGRKKKTQHLRDAQKEQKNRRGRTSG